MIIRTATDGLVITPPIATKITMIGAKISIVSIIIMVPLPGAVIGDFTVGSTVIMLISIMIIAIPLTTVAGGEVGTRKDIIMTDGMATGTGMVIGTNIIDTGIIHIDKTE